MAGAYSGPLQVIDPVSSTTTWYQVANHSSLLKTFPCNPFQTLIDARSAVHGAAAPDIGHSTPPLPPSDSITQFYPSAPSFYKPALDREAFGSTVLCDFLHSHPDAFELSHHGNPGLPDDFRVVYYNINGLDGLKHAELLAFMSVANVDCLVLIDARVSKINSHHYLRKTRAELGPGAVVLPIRAFHLY